MDAIEIINSYGIVVLISGLLACVLCGILKVPISRAVRAKNKDSKVASDKIRYFCTLTVAVLSVIFVAIWYGATGGIKVFVSVKVYAEMLAAFTAAKVIYMLYEGFDKASIKKLVHALFEKFKTKSSENAATIVTDDVINLADRVQVILAHDLQMPLVKEQYTVLIERLRDK